MTDQRNLRVRRCECSECVPLQAGSAGTARDEPTTPTPGWMLDEDEPRDWSSVGRNPAPMPLPSRIWGLDR
jgi:hypothetical protein